MSRQGKENLETFLFFPCENGSPIRDKEKSRRGILLLKNKQQLILGHIYNFHTLQVSVKDFRHELSTQEEEKHCI